jgi:predicted nuclease of predicted toxin-antitoxin system
MTKDSDFSHLIRQLGSPPKIICLRCGNTSNERLRIILESTLRNTMALLEAGETLVEIRDDTGREDIDRN